ncbi:MAG TPA: hypothetical protein VGC72_13450 [Candidatus Elarobacter sp.]|jgi:hypothetical protein
MSTFDSMNHEDDLDRAIAALPLAEPPAGFHARVMAATVYRPEPAVRGWEVWVIGTVVAVAAWLSWVVATTPRAVEEMTGAAIFAVQSAGLTSSYTVLWLAVGMSAAWWISQLSVPTTRSRIEAR